MQLQLEHDDNQGEGRAIATNEANRLTLEAQSEVEASSRRAMADQILTVALERYSQVAREIVYYQHTPPLPPITDDAGEATPLTATVLTVRQTQTVAFLEMCSQILALYLTLWNSPAFLEWGATNAASASPSPFSQVFYP